MKQKVLNILELFGIVLGSDLLLYHIPSTKEMRQKEQFVEKKLFC